MKTRRWAITGIALIATLGLATAGCGGSTGSTPTASSPTPVDAKQALVNSVKGLEEGNFTFTIGDNESTGSGTVHAPSKSAHLDVKVTQDGSPGNFAIIIVDQERWVKMDFGPEVNTLLKLPTKWMHIDITKITDAQALKDLSIDFSNVSDLDPAGSATLFASLVTVERTGEGAYAGTVDLTKATDSEMVDEEIVGKLGDKAKTIPFTATVDGQGRLTKLSLEMPAAGDTPPHKVEVKFTDYGSATAVQKPPAGQTQDAPATAYEFLNG